MHATSILTVAWLTTSCSGVPGLAVDPIMELQSAALTPGIVLPEMKGPIHQVRLLVDIDGRGPGRGTLVFDPNLPEFDEFGTHVGGLNTPYVKRKGGPLRPVELACVIEFVKEGPDSQDGTGKWLLFRLSAPKLRSNLFVSTRGPMLEGGPARLLVVIDGKVRSVVDMTRFGLALP